MAKSSRTGRSSAPGAADWFADSPFNLLVDYYTEVPFRPYGSGATRQNVLPVLRELKIGCIIIYAKGHSGTTTFKSALRTEHPMLAQDMPKAFREMTREAGARLFLYYSGLVDGIAGERHPEWRMLDPSGKRQQILKDFESLFLAHPICPLSEYFEQWVSVHLREMIERYQPDGIWVDGDWPGPCYCPRCRERFQHETGLAQLPSSADPSTPEGLAWTRTWASIMHDWRMRFRNFVKHLKPDCLYSAGNVTARREFLEPFDWRSGDWFSPNNHRLHMSLVLRRYTTLGLPYDAYTCDTCFVHAWPQIRARSKPLDRMLQEGSTLLANGASWGYWTYPMPHGALVPSKMRTARHASAFAHARKEICLKTESVRWNAILDCEPGAALLDWNRGAWLGAGKALLALHRSPDIIDESALEGRIPYELIVVPEMRVIEDPVVEKLEAFVRQGGKLLTTGDSIRSEKLQQLLGVKLVRRGEIGDGHVLLADARPAGVYAPWDRLELCGAQELYPLYLPWDAFNPEERRIRPCYPITGMLDEEHPLAAGFAAATLRRLGKGLAIHIPTAFFQTYWRFGNPDMLAWLREIVEVLQPDPWFRTDAKSFIEVALRRKGDTLLIHLVNGNPGRDISQVGTEDLWVNDIPAIGPIRCEVRCRRKPRSVWWEPDHKPLAFSYRGGLVRVKVPKLAIHGCVALSPWAGW